MKLKQAFKTGAALGALCLIAAGCQDTVNTVENQDKQMQLNQIQDRRCITDGFLRRRLLIHTVNTAVGESGLLQVQIGAVNNRTGFFSELWSGIMGDNPYKVDYQFTWFDQNGMAVETNLSIWKTVTVYPGENVWFRGVAPSPACNDFMISMKESK